MALIRALSGSGGGSKSHIGEFTITAQNQIVDVNDIGFRPKQIAIVFQGNGGSGTSAAVGAYRLVYDERYSTAYSHRAVYAASSNYVVDSAEITLSSAKSCIIEINDNGFKFVNKGSGTTVQGKYYYFALG